jgi:hypothetical protein
MRICFAAPILIVTLLLPLSAHAALSEIKADFVGLTAPLPATPIFTPPPVATNYLLCAAFGTEPILSWTDENGLAQSAQLGVGGLGLNNCRLIRNAANTAAIIACSAGPCTGPAPYDLYIVGFGFWPDAPQKQGGITETHGDGPSALPGGTYLLAVTARGGCQWTANWTGANRGSITGSASQLLAINAAVYGKSSATYTVQPYNNPADDGCQINTTVIAFGVPAAGSGPLTDYERDLLDWTDATYPYYMVVFTAPAGGANFVLASNIAERQNSGTVNEMLTPLWSGAILPVTPFEFVAEPTGRPASVVVVGSVPGGDPVEFWTVNTTGRAWGASPSYSAEVDIIQF